MADGGFGQWNGWKEAYGLAGQGEGRKKEAGRGLVVGK